MDLRKVKKLIELLNESGVGEIEITEGEDSVRISRESTSIMTPSQKTQKISTPPENKEDQIQHEGYARPKRGHCRMGQS